MPEIGYVPPHNEIPTITLKKIYADTNTSNLKKVVLDIPTFSGEETNFAIILDTDILDYLYQGLLSFRFSSLGGVSIANPDGFSVENGVVNTTVKTVDGDLFAFTFEKVENTDHNYEYDIIVAIKLAELEPHGDPLEGDGKRTD